MFEFVFSLFSTPPEAARIPLAMLAIFGTAKLLAELFERIGQPGIVGEILAGVLIGPSVLGWVEPNELLRSLADIGVMFLLFRVGLEVKPAELLKLGGTATIVAACGVIVIMMAPSACRAQPVLQARGLRMPATSLVRSLSC